MKIFVSWSGGRGRLFAEAVCRLLGSDRGQAPFEPWMSTQIRHGRPWAAELLAQLEVCKTCIVCVTADTVASRWLGFEAGAVLGAGAEPGQVVCLGLNVEPGMLEGHLLSRFQAFDATADGVLALWQALRPGVAPAWPADAWREFERACAAVPDAMPIDFTLYLHLGEKQLSAHPIKIDQDVAFDDVLVALLQSHGQALEADERRAMRCLDLDRGCWVPMPWRLSGASSRRLVVMDARALQRYEGSDRLATMMLREGIDVFPRAKVAIASLRRDLRDLLTQQIAFHAEHGRYAAQMEELDFTPASGNDIEMVGRPGGFAAMGYCDGTPMPYGVRLGDGAGEFQGQPDGVLFGYDRGWQASAV